MKHKITILIKRFLTDRFSPDIEERIQKWILSNHYKKEKEEASFLYWEELHVPLTSNTYKSLDKVNTRIGFQSSKKIKLPLYHRLSQIAVLLLIALITAGSYLYYTRAQNPWVEITIPYGESRHLLLPDSSEVWANAGTTIRYPKKFANNQRTLRLNGEAYFDIKKNQQRPFTVTTQHLTVKVVGTTFNIKAYSQDNYTKATLITGKIEVTSNHKETKILHPKEQLILNHLTSQVTVESIVAEIETGWINGQLIFTNASMDEILQTLERRFNLTIVADSAYPDERYTIKFSKNDSLEHILSILAEISGHSIQQQDTKIIISSCP